jgi:hypothetical protein
VAIEAEFSGVLNASNTVFTIAVTAAVPVGKFLVVSVEDAAATALTTTATDSRGNTYVRDWSKPNDPTTVSGSVHQLRTKVTTALQIGDVITVTFSGAATRAAGYAGQYGESITIPHTAGSVGNTGASGTVTSSALATGNFSPVTIGDLEVASIGFISSGRVFTPAAGWTAGTKIASTSGSGDRAVQQMWRLAASTAAQTASGTFNSSALWSICAESYAIASGGRTGRLKYNGVNKPTKYNGVEKPWKYNGVLAK